MPLQDYCEYTRSSDPPPGLTRDSLPKSLRQLQLPSDEPAFQQNVLYSLLLHKSIIYCGTSGSDIAVFNFTSGECTMRLPGGRGAVCLKAYRGLVFSGCYDGHVYAHSMETGQRVGQLKGPGRMLLAIDIIGGKIIAASKDSTLAIWDIPDEILKHAVPK